MVRAGADDLSLRVPAGGGTAAAPSRQPRGERPAARRQRVCRVPPHLPAARRHRHRRRDAAGVPVHAERLRRCAAHAVRHADTGHCHELPGQPACRPGTQPDAAGARSDRGAGRAVVLAPPARRHVGQERPAARLPARPVATVRHRGGGTDGLRERHRTLHRPGRLGAARPVPVADRRSRAHRRLHRHRGIHVQHRVGERRGRSGVGGGGAADRPAGGALPIPDRVARARRGHQHVRASWAAHCPVDALLDAAHRPGARSAGRHCGAADLRLHRALRLARDGHQRGRCAQRARAPARFCPPARRRSPAPFPDGGHAGHGPCARSGRGTGAAVGDEGAADQPVRVAPRLLDADHPHLRILRGCLHCRGRAAEASSWWCCRSCSPGSWWSGARNTPERPGRAMRASTRPCARA